MLVDHEIPVEDIARFIKRVPPFQFLDDDALGEIASAVTTRYYPKGTMILTQGGAASGYLQIIKKGSVKVFIASGVGEPVNLDFRGEGDLVGYLSLFSERSKANVRAEEDTTCYLISRETIRHLLDRHPAFAEFFLKSYLNIYIDKTFSAMRNKNLLSGSGNKVLFTTPVGELITREPVTAPHDVSIQEAAELMSQEEVSCLVVVDAEGLPAGIVTDSDLREKVVARGRSLIEPVKSVMSLPLIRVNDGDYCFEALLKMAKYNVHHLLVIKGGKLRGVLTDHDLMMLQGTSPLSLIKDIENEHSVEGLVETSRKINGIVGLLLREGAKAGNITNIISEIYDRLVKRVLEIAEKQFGKAPIAYCWIALAGEGRKEQVFRCDQDNAIILADPKTEAELEESGRYFPLFTAFVRDSLARCGFPPCTGDFMASNPIWCQPLSVWKTYFRDWITAPGTETVLRSVIFFDFRPVHGDFGLAHILRESVIAMLRDQEFFLGYLAGRAVKNRPPIGFLKSFVVEKSGEHSGELDLKSKGIDPIVEMVRLFALEKDVRETSTSERVEKLKERHTIVRDYGEDLLQVFEFLMLLKIHHQNEQIKAGQEPDNFINPNELLTLEKKTLKEVFHFISKLQEMVMEQYKPAVW